MNPESLLRLSTRFAAELMQAWETLILQRMPSIIWQRMIPPEIDHALYLAWLQIYIKYYARVDRLPKRHLFEGIAQFSKSANDINIKDIEKEYAPELDKELILKVANEFRSKVWPQITPLQEFKQRFSNAVIAGASAEDLAKELRDATQDSMMHWQALRIARTELMKFYNIQQINSYWRDFAEAPAELMALLAGFRYSVVRDERTSDYCKPLADVYISIRDWRRALVPPFHPNCRTILVPVFEQDVAPGGSQSHLRKILIDQLPLNMPRGWQTYTINDLITEPRPTGRVSAKIPAPASKAPAQQPVQQPPSKPGRKTEDEIIKGIIDARAKLDAEVARLASEYDQLKASIEAEIDQLDKEYQERYKEYQELSKELSNASLDERKEITNKMHQIFNELIRIPKRIDQLKKSLAKARHESELKAMAFEFGLIQNEIFPLLELPPDEQAGDELKALFHFDHSFYASDVAQAELEATIDALSRIIPKNHKFLEYHRRLPPDIRGIELRIESSPSFAQYALALYEPKHAARDVISIYVKEVKNDSPQLKKAREAAALNNSQFGAILASRPSQLLAHEFGHAMEYRGEYTPSSYVFNAQAMSKLCSNNSLYSDFMRGGWSNISAGDAKSSLRLLNRYQLKLYKEHITGSVALTEVMSELFEHFLSTPMKNIDINEQMVRLGVRVLREEEPRNIAEKALKKNRVQPRDYRIWLEDSLKQVQNDPSKRMKLSDKLGKIMKDYLKELEKHKKSLP